MKLSVALALISVSLALGPVVVADFTLEDWRYVKAIAVPETLPEAGLVELSLDRETFHEAAPALADLRVVQDDSLEVPYKLTVERGETKQQSYPVKIRDLGHVAGEYTSFVVDLDREGSLHNQVEIRTNSYNFRRNVVVEGSSDAQDWAVLQKGAEIFDFTIKERGLTARDTRVHYPESAYRYLRVRIVDGAEGPLGIDGAAVFSTLERPPEETAFPAPIVQRTEDTANRTSVLLMDVGSRGLPTHRLSVSTPTDNFYREVTLEGSLDNVDWRRLTNQAAIYSFNTPKFVGGQLEVSYPEESLRYFRLTIRNEDNPPVAVERVSLVGVARRVLFQPRPDASRYSLYYGNPEARAPSYDLERILPYLETGQLPAAGLGPRLPNPAFRVAQPPATEGYPWLVPVAVGVAAVAVALLLLGVVKRARAVLPPPG